MNCFVFSAAGDVRNFGNFRDKICAIDGEHKTELFGVFPTCFHWNQWIQKQKYLSSKGLKLATSCARQQDATTVPTQHIWETESLNWTQFMLRDLSHSLNSLNSMKVLLHLGKTPSRVFVLFSCCCVNCFVFREAGHIWNVHDTTCVTNPENR